MSESVGTDAVDHPSAPADDLDETVTQQKAEEQRAGPEADADVAAKPPSKDPPPAPKFRFGKASHRTGSSLVTLTTNN